MKKLTLFALSALLAGTFAVAADMKGEMMEAKKDINSSMSDMKEMKDEMKDMHKDVMKEGKQMKDEMKGEMKKEMKKGM